MAKYGKQNPYHPRHKPVHGYVVTGHPLYSTWCNMKSRCENPDDPNYPNYGARGIAMCKRWHLSFEAFALDVGLPPSPLHTLDRRDNEKGYTPENCGWATRTEQCHNRRVFSSNTSGKSGVVAVKNRFNARWDHEGLRYNLGRFATLAEADSARKTFSELFFIDREAAMLMTERRARHDNKTGVRGITKSPDGYIVRKTLEGVRVYLGTRKTLEEATALWNDSK